MKKIIIFFTIALFGFPNYAQVGINNIDPKASLDITATNQANPSNTDGLLIPRIDTFPTTNPTAAQQGMLVYLTTTSGSNNPGYYYWDNNAGPAAWVGVFRDEDWTEVGSDLERQSGDVYIGNTNTTDNNLYISNKLIDWDNNLYYLDPNSLSKVNKLSLDNGSSTNPSFYFSSSDTGFFSPTSSTIAYSASGTEAFRIQDNGKITFGTTSASSFDILMKNSFNTKSLSLGANNSANIPLIDGMITGDSQNNIISTSILTGNRTFSHSAIKSTSVIGDVFVALAENLGATVYGVRSVISEDNTVGNKYGIYSDATKTNSYAGYFLGRVSIGTTTSNNYILPSTRGSNGQVMRTDGVGNLSWVTPTQSDADWFEEGTTSAPNTINDNIFTNGFVGIGDNTPDNILDVEYTGNTDHGVSISYNNTDNSGPTRALIISSENLAGATSSITGAYIQVKNSTGTNYTTSVYAFNTASGTKNIGLSAVANGAGQNNYGNSGTANGASQNNYGGFFTANSTIGKNYGVKGYAFGAATNWAGYFGDLATIPEVGSGNVYIQDLLQVDGALKFTSGANNNYILKTDASGNATWVDPTVIFTNTNTQNTLDQAYDEGGVGAGRIIAADSGAVSIEGSDGFQVTGTSGTGATISLSGAGTRMFFNPRKGAFRAGSVNDTQWDNANVGNNSFAVGLNNIASGSNSVAMGSYNETSGNSSIAAGSYTTASGNYSVAAGYGTIASGSSSIALGGNSKASGNSSTAFGSQAQALGDNSIAFGSFTKAFSFSEIAIGIHSTTYTPLSTTTFNASDRLFVIGNGVDSSNKSNALTIYKNGLLNINDEYNMPLVDGTANQIMQTNGTGQVSFVDPTGLQDADWYETGGTPPNSINDNIYTNGKVGINNVSPSSSLDIVSNSSGSAGQLSVTESDANDGARILFKNTVETSRKWTIYARSDNTAADNYFNIHNTTIGNILSVRGNGKIGIKMDPNTNELEVNGKASKATSGSWIANSDRRLKKDIVKIEGKTALDKIMKMKGVTYLWNDTQTGINRPTDIQYGFIAQELMQVFPEKVTMDNLGFYQTAYGDYDPIFVEAIKELKTEVDILEEENQQLKQQLKKYEDLEARLSALEDKSPLTINN